jgi:O-methyltransferase involved in polyketide biosynthesis
VDQPDVIEFKTRTLAELVAELTAIHRPIAVDLRNDWRKTLWTTLQRHCADRTDPEGLLIYLPPAAQDQLFDTITELSARGQPARHRTHPGQERLLR